MTRSAHEVMLAYAVSARLVELHGQRFVPFFELMEHEVEELRRQDDAVHRARAASALTEKLRRPGLPGNTAGNTRLARR